MIKTIALLASAFTAGGVSATYLPVTTPPPTSIVRPQPVAPLPELASKNEVEALRQQIMIWKDMNEQQMNELSREFSAMNNATVAVHNDLLRAENERATARAQAANDAKRTSFAPFIQQAQKATH